MFVYVDVVYGQTWQILTLKKCIEPLSYAITAYVIASYGPRFFSTVFEKIWATCKNFSGKWFPPPPPHLQKIARTAMVVGGVGKNGNVLILLTPIPSGL